MQDKLNSKTLKLNKKLTMLLLENQEATASAIALYIYLQQITEKNGLVHLSPKMAMHTLNIKSKATIDAALRFLDKNEFIMLCYKGNYSYHIVLPHYDKMFAKGGPGYMILHEDQIELIYNTKTKNKLKFIVYEYLKIDGATRFGNAHKLDISETLTTKGIFPRYIRPTHIREFITELNGLVFTYSGQEEEVRSLYGVHYIQHARWSDAHEKLISNNIRKYAPMFNFYIKQLKKLQVLNTTAYEDINAISLDVANLLTQYDIMLIFDALDDAITNKTKNKKVINNLPAYLTKLIRNRIMTEQNEYLMSAQAN